MEHEAEEFNRLREMKVQDEETITLLLERLSASEARVKALEDALGDLSDAMPDVIYVYDAGCEGSYWTEIEPTEGIYTTINFAALLASPTSPAEPGASNPSLKTLDQRLESLAVEAENLEALTTAEPWRRSILEAVEEREYKTAIAKATGNWEPPDPPGWEGGFAENH